MNKNFLITWYYDNTGRSRNRATGDLRSAHAVNPTVQGRGVKVRKSVHPDISNYYGSLYTLTSISIALVLSYRHFKKKSFSFLYINKNAKINLANFELSSRRTFFDATDELFVNLYFYMHGDKCASIRSNPLSSYIFLVTNFIKEISKTLLTKSSKSRHLYGQMHPSFLCESRLCIRVALYHFLFLLILYY